MQNRIDVARLVSSLISSPVFPKQRRKKVRRCIYKLFSEEHIVESNIENNIAHEVNEKYISKDGLSKCQFL